MQTAFRQFVDQYQQLVYSQAMFILADQGEAEDATQEAFIRLWARMNKAESDQLEPTACKPWLLHVVRNLCIDRLRKRKPVSDVELDDFENTQAHSLPASELLSKQLSAWLKSAIARLKEPYQSLIILADLQQRSIKEVAQSLNLSENQAKVYIHRGRKQLRGLLQGIEL